MRCHGEGKCGIKMERQASETELGYGAAWGNIPKGTVPSDGVALWNFEGHGYLIFNLKFFIFLAVLPQIFSKVSSQRPCMKGAGWRRSESWVCTDMAHKWTRHCVCKVMREFLQMNLIGNLSQSPRNPEEAMWEAWGMFQPIYLNQGYAYWRSEWEKVWLKTKQTNKLWNQNLGIFVQNGRSYHLYSTYTQHMKVDPSSSFTKSCDSPWHNYIFF